MGWKDVVMYLFMPTFLIEVHIFNPSQVNQKGNILDDLTLHNYKN